MSAPLGKFSPPLHGWFMENLEDQGAHDDAPPATPAATVVVFRRDAGGGPAQLLLVERSGSLAFAGGATVFPGGKVDPADYELAHAVSGDLEHDDVAARIAAIRETLEETGLAIGMIGAVDAARAVRARALLLETGRLSDVLAAFEWALDLDALVPFARWLPKHRNMRVFDTRFYLADLGTGAVDVVVDATENRHLFWASAAEALQLANDGAIKVIFPTRRNLERLALFEDFAAARAHALATPIITMTPRIEMREGQQWLTIPSDGGYPIDGEALASAARA
jgi:8-oxo-dGTP pyrophosphatase MutT (NUDIX family)